MKRLNLVDASFVRRESDQTPMHVAALLLFQLPDGVAEGLHFGFTACRDAVPHAQRIAVALPDELGRLERSLGVSTIDQPVGAAEPHHG